jgi:hypothetical protein
MARIRQQEIKRRRKRRKESIKVRKNEAMKK